MSEQYDNDARGRHTLYEKHPDLETTWLRMREPELHRMKEQYDEARSYEITCPIAWEDAGVLDAIYQARREFAGTSVILRQLATQSYQHHTVGDADQDRVRELQKALLVMDAEFARLHIGIEELAATAEYCWLQKNIPGDFSSMPAARRKEYTQTSYLTDDNRFAELFERTRDSAYLRMLPAKVERLLFTAEDALGEVRQHIRDIEPPSDALDVALDHNTCGACLLPHMREQLASMHEEIPIIGSHIDSLIAKRRNEPTRTESPSERPTAKVIHISEGVRIRAKNAAREEGQTP